MEKQRQLPTPGTRAYDLLALTALSGEYPANSVGRTAYAEKVVARLKADGLLRTVYRDRLRSYRLTAAAKHRLLVTAPSRFAFYLTGSTDTNRVKSEPVRRLRLHRVARVYTSVYKAGITLFRDEKPCPFSAAALHHSAPATFYGSREVKGMGVETVKIRGSRMVGVPAAPARADRAGRHDHRRTAGAVRPSARLASVVSFLLGAETVRPAGCAGLLRFPGSRLKAWMLLTDIAKQYDVPPNHVGVWISRAASKLREETGLREALLE